MVNWEDAGITERNRKMRTGSRYGWLGVYTTSSWVKIS